MSEIPAQVEDGHPGPPPVVSVLWMRILMAVLMTSGIALAVVALLVWRTPGPTTISHESDVSTVHSSSTLPETPPSPAASSTATPVETSQTTTSVKDVSQLSLPSDAIIGTILGTAAILVMVGAFFPRIAKVVVPGGGEIDLTPLADQAAAAVAKQAHIRLDAAAQGGAEPIATDPLALGARAGAATAVALQNARRIIADPKGYGTRSGLSTHQISTLRNKREMTPDIWESLANQALDAVGFPEPPK